MYVAVVVTLVQLSTRLWMIYSLDLLMFDELFTFSLLVGRLVTRPFITHFALNRTG